MQKNADRKIYLDILRILAIFLVLFTHTGELGSKLYTITDKGFLRTAYLYLDCFRTINNPLLFMVSGALLLGKDESLKTVWKKRIFRFVIVLVLFTYLQAIVQCYHEHDFSNFSGSGILIQMLEKPIRFSYWYLYSYISFLILLPILRNIAIQIDHKMFIYILIIALITQDVFRILSCFLGISSINISLSTNSIYILYPLLGFYLDSHYNELQEKYKYVYQILAVMSLCGLSAAVWFSVQLYDRVGSWSEQYITLFYTITAISIFCIAKELTQFLLKKDIVNNKIILLLKKVSGATFGIYLMENILEYFTLPVYNFFRPVMPSIFACLLYLLVTMILGTIVINILKKVPLLNILL